MMPPVQRLVLVTDFGEGLYVGQMRARLDALLPGMPVIDLIHDLPAFRPELAAYLLPALVRDLPAGALYLCVVDPGVGGVRDGLIVQAGGSWFIGPDNGLLSLLLRSDEAAWVQRLGWSPPEMSASFHGRDWFVPAAARWCAGDDLALTPLDSGACVGADWPHERDQVIYVDRFGNLMSGIGAAGRSTASSLLVGGRMMAHARTFCEAPIGEAFWYENALGLVEIAVNQGRACDQLGLLPGDAIGPFVDPRSGVALSTT